MIELEEIKRTSINSRKPPNPSNTFIFYTKHDASIDTGTWYNANSIAGHKRVTTPSDDNSIFRHEQQKHERKSRSRDEKFLAVNKKIRSIFQTFRARAIWNNNVQATKEGYCYKLQLSNSNLISSVSFFGHHKSQEGMGSMETTEGTWNFHPSIIYLTRLPFPSLQLRFVISIYMFSLRLIYHSHDNFSEELRRKKKKGILWVGEKWH